MSIVPHNRFLNQWWISHDLSFSTQSLHHLYFFMWIWLRAFHTLGCLWKVQTWGSYFQKLWLRTFAQMANEFHFAKHCSSVDRCWLTPAVTCATTKCGVSSPPIHPLRKFPDIADSTWGKALFMSASFSYKQCLPAATTKFRGLCSWTKINLSLTVWRLEHPRSRWQLVWFLCELSSWLADACLTVFSHGGKRVSFLVSPLVRVLILLGQGSILMTLYLLSYFFMLNIDTLGDGRLELQPPLRLNLGLSGTQFGS